MLDAAYCPGGGEKRHLPGVHRTREFSGARGRFRASSIRVETRFQSDWADDYRKPIAETARTGYGIALHLDVLHQRLFITRMHLWVDRVGDSVQAGRVRARPVQLCEIQIRSSANRHSGKMRRYPVAHQLYPMPRGSSLLFVKDQHARHRHAEGKKRFQPEKLMLSVVGKEQRKFKATGEQAALLLGAPQSRETVRMVQVEVDAEMIQVKSGEQFRVSRGEFDIMGCDPDAQQRQPHAE